MWKLGLIDQDHYRFYLYKSITKNIFQQGVEPNILHVFAKREGFNLKWIDAKYTWGALDPDTG